MGILKSPNISNLPFSFILFSRRSRKSIAKTGTLEFGGLQITDRLMVDIGRSIEKLLHSIEE